MTAPSLQSEMARALLDPLAPIPDNLVSWNGSNPERRVAVHRNTVTVTLIDALAARFPVVRELVGAEFFAAMAREFVRAQPPRTPVLLTYGERFPAFIAAFAPATGVPYLADVAALEAARTRAYHAADAVPLRPEEFSALDPAALTDLAVDLHPSMQLLTSRHAILSLWLAHQGNIDIASVDPFVPEDALVVRPFLDVEMIRLPPGAALLLGRLAGGESLGAAAVSARAYDEGCDLVAAMHVLVTTGVVTRLRAIEGAPS